MSDERDNMGKKNEEQGEDVEAHGLQKPGLEKGMDTGAPSDDGDDVEAHGLQKPGLQK